MFDRNILDNMKSYDIIGDVIIIKENNRKFANSLLKRHKNVKTILFKSDIHKGKFRTQKLKFLSGKRTKETTYKENNITIKLNLEKVYFSSRLGNERKRVSNLIKNESVLILFSGVGIYPLVIAKNSKCKEVYGIELNKIAHNYALNNIQLNKLSNKIILINGDVSKVKLKKKFDRILMPLPKSATDFLKDAFKFSRKGTIIHFYIFGQEKEFNQIKKNLIEKCKKLKKKIKIIKLVRCGQYRPYTYRICIDFRVL